MPLFDVIGRKSAAGVKVLTVIFRMERAKSNLKKGTGHAIESSSVLMDGRGLPPPSGGRNCGGRHTVVKPDEKVFRDRKAASGSYVIPKQLMRR